MAVFLGRVDIPLPVGGNVIANQAAIIYAAAQDVSRLAPIELRLIGYQVLTEVKLPRVVEVESLAPCQRAPRNQVLDIQAPGGVGSILER